MRLLRYLVPAAMLLAGFNLLRAGDPPPTLTAADRARRAEQVHRLQLQQRHDAHQQQVRALSHLQARHHETMMVIIGNMRPTGRMVYNPSTGKYDRYLSD
jgi:hypothetical protein